MSRPHVESLRAQLTTAMATRLGSALAESVFQHDLWPVLDKAMTAGELLVARNTDPQIPVHTAIRRYMNGCLSVFEKVRAQNSTIKRHELMQLVYSFEDGVRQALKDADELDKLNFDNVRPIP